MVRRGGKRRLTDAEHELWSSVAQTAEPLDPQARDAAPARPPNPAPIHGRTRDTGHVSPPIPRPQPTAKPALRPGVSITSVPDPMEAMTAPAPGMDHRFHARIRRGKVMPDARIDLHGMTAARAHRELRGFVLGAHAGGARLLLVITGKGRRGTHDHAPDRIGVLRHEVPVWLQQAPIGRLVMDVTPAHRSHGGGGAYYVSLRKRR